MQPALVIFFWPRISTAVPNAGFMIDEYKTSKIGKRSRQAWIMQGYVLRRTIFDAHKNTSGTLFPLFGQPTALCFYNQLFSNYAIAPA